ncbi:MAG: hypothetical protein CVT76_01050 [Alphaproteobacteria bacterium HGW-Alphaproteobacteria-15]|nr:MAG: hypothetical protein CVT76_01050 [Alphaproteobacteria bacterium HGW-Alphaproteobacteria-15]
MLIALMLAVEPTCRPPDNCPSPDEVVAAFNAFEQAIEWDLQADASRETTDIVSVTVHRTRRVTKLRCATARAQPTVVQCSGILHRYGSRSKQSFHLTKIAEGWRFDPKLTSPPE